MNQTERTDPLHQLRLWHRFHIRLLALFGGTVVLTLLIMGAWFYAVGVQAELDSVRKRLRAFVSSLAETIDADAIAQFPVDQAEMTALHRELKKQFGRVANSDPDVDSIYVLRPTDVPTELRFFIDYAKDDDVGLPGEEYSAAELPDMLKGFNQTVVEEEPARDKWGLSISGYAPLRTREGKSIGVVGVDIDVARLDLIRNRVLTTSLGALGIAIALVTAVSFLVSRSIRDPLRVMINAMEAIARGQLDTRLELKRQDEFGVLGKHLDHMAADLGERELLREAFGRYVSREVACALLEDGQVPVLGGEERVVTVLFSDLREYSSISETLSPVQMVSMLNEYLGAMNTIIDDSSGCVIEYLGDAILAVFGAPKYFPDHAEKAVACARAMRERLEGLNKDWEERGWASLWQRAGVESIEMRVGIHTGSVVAGNLGSATRMKYAVIGDSVNVAARLEALNKQVGTSILLSEEVRAHLSSVTAADLTDRGEFEVKGRKKTVRVYSV